MNRLILFSIFLTSFHPLFSQKYNVVDTLSKIRKLKAGSVIAYDFNNQVDSNFRSVYLVDLIGTDGRFNPTVEMPGRALSKREIVYLIETVLNWKNYETDFYEAKGCYIPRHGFLFLDKYGRKLAYLDICLECRKIAYSDLVENKYYRLSFYDNGSLLLTDMIRKLGLKIWKEVEEDEKILDMPASCSFCDEQQKRGTRKEYRVVMN